MRVFQLFIVAAFAAFTCVPVQACSCASPTKSPAELVDEGWIVVKGIAEPSRAVSDSIPLKAYKFRVVSSVNAKLADTITLLTPQSSATCGSALDFGTTSIVAISREGPKEPNTYYFNSCGQYAIQHDFDGWDAILDATD